MLRDSKSKQPRQSRVFSAPPLCARALGASTAFRVRHRKALAVFQKLPDNNPAATEFRGRQAACHNNLGMLVSNHGKPLKAEADRPTQTT
jgi:hypothetical protein